MRWLLLVELLAVAAASGAFTLLYWLRSPWRASPEGRMVMAWVLVSGLEAGLFSLSYVVRLPLALFVVLYGVTALLAVQRLTLLLRRQHREMTKGE